mgnify:CR=1 FL=1
MFLFGSLFCGYGKEALLAACKPLILLGFHRSFNDTPTNVYANTALEEAGLQLFGMLDFAWVAIPIFIIGGIYMVIMNRWCSSCLWCWAP